MAINIREATHNAITAFKTFIRWITDTTAGDISATFTTNGVEQTYSVPNSKKINDRVDEFIVSATNSMSFLNLIKNPHIQKKDTDGNYIEIPHTFYDMDMESYRVVDSSIDNIPQEVKDYIADGLIRGHGNVLEIKLTSRVGHNLWLSSNSISGTFSGGWKWVYVSKGRLRNINAGEIGSFFDVKINRNWNIDLPMGDFDDNTIVYMAHPFLVAGRIKNIADVKTLNYTHNTKYANLY